MKVLDCGYVEAVEHWGSDERIIEAARMSTGKGFLGWGPMHRPECPLAGSSINTFGVAEAGVGRACDGQCGDGKPGDEKLLRFLYDNRHHTPFEMAGIIIEVKAPIFVFREWHRHRTQSYNEMSARYTPLPDENYLPTIERLMVNSKTNKQAGTVKGAGELTEQGADAWLRDMSKFYQEAETMYQAGLMCGVPKELARLCLPVARYSRMRASANLRNWLAFLTLRMDKAAQFEIREYANAVGEIIAERFPRTWELFIGGFNA